MPRVRVRKTSRGQIELSRYRDAYEEVKAGDSLRNAADKHGINYCSLLRYIRKRDASGEDDQVMGYRAHNEEQEQELSKYLIRCADIYFGLPKKEVRKLAYELTIKYNLSRPRTWEDNQIADRPNHEYTTGSAVVSTLNAIPSEDKTPPLSPSLLTEELQTETTVQQQAINNSPVPTKEQENVDERQYTLSTPPRRCSSIINQETSPRPSTSVQAISKNPIVFTPEAVRPLPKAPPRKSNKGRKTRKSTIYTDTPEKEAIRKEHETRLERIKSKQVKKSLDGRKGRKILQEEKKVIHSRKCHQKRKNATVLFVCHHIQKADPEKSGFNASLVNSGLTKNAQKVVLAMFATIATQIDPYAKL
ncbi:hypothetical protein JTB14_000101 [Gonioctena quinquepunctata]|nr:hypothetical protein JTB14_000101 [Gonioctena quinquepunctata]